MGPGPGWHLSRIYPSPRTAPMDGGQLHRAGQRKQRRASRTQGGSEVGQYRRSFPLGTVHQKCFYGRRLPSGGPIVESISLTVRPSGSAPTLGSRCPVCLAASHLQFVSHMFLTPHQMFTCGTAMGAPTVLVTAKSPAKRSLRVPRRPTENLCVRRWHERHGVDDTRPWLGR